MQIRMSSPARLLATQLALAPVVAHADPAQEPLLDGSEPPKLAILAGPGVRAQWLHDDMGSSSKTRMLPSLAATIAYRMSPNLALGIHANAARSSDEMVYPDETITWSVLSLDLGIALQYERGGFTVTPWVGRHISRYHHDDTLCTFGVVTDCTDSHVTEWTNDFTSYGLTASLPIRGVPIAVFFVLQGGLGRTAYDTSTPSFNYSAATLGLAYQQ